MNTAAANDANKRKGVIYGAAIGDALGVPYEFLERDTFKCANMIGNGSHHKPAGTFSDDTSMLLATLASVEEHRAICPDDMRERFCDWYYNGAYTADGVVFGVGRTTAVSLKQGHGLNSERSNGNGSLMRIAPLAFIQASDEEICAASAVTHAHWISTESCVIFVRILREVMNGESLEDAIKANSTHDEPFEFLETLASTPRKEIGSSGFVLDTLQASLWCALHTNTFKDCVLEAVNLGEDTDTTACVAGALAGAMYGFDAIPKEWVDALRGKLVIESYLF
ncbi:ADP-ribosylglycohydrolase family protein [Adlercreutzia agrestimuris]|uniref:ADP-ribosylglycohydrolase family protein n=1 Tax=Adlercreutzia agrestimuris TaxID=2941324 RepID=UPI00203B24FE|nr:ADP-ribosylglycohydrolase family protein [Adlercreutzia agrestimuris]